MFPDAALHYMMNAVYKDGKVCISILHPPGNDPNGYESAAERWSPVQSVEKILLSVISMLAEPNDESPANIDAAVCRDFSLLSSSHYQILWRNDRAAFNKKVKDSVKASLGQASTKKK